MNIQPLHSARKILVRAVNWLGDAVMTTPALQAVRETFPDAEITILANPLVSQLLYGHPAIDRVITFERNGKHGGIAGRLRLAAELHRERFDLALILPNSFDSALIPFLAGIPKRLGKASDGRSLLLTGRYRKPQQDVALHEVQYYRNLLGHFGITAAACRPFLSVTPEEEREAALFLAEQGINTGELLLGINAGATYGSAKRWYPERFAQVAGKLAQEWGAQVILFGGPDEQDIAKNIADNLDRACLNLAGRTSVRRLMTLIKRCSFFITNDSGPMHIAAAFGVPLVAVFGPTDHSGTAPFSDQAVIVRKPVECAPCKLRHCPADHRCMTAISAEEVLAAARRLWYASRHNIS